MIIDLTHTITPEMPVFPGSPQPELKSAATLTRDGYRETLITLASHTGTHMDAPTHILQHGSSLDQLPISNFCGRATVLDVSAIPEGGVITAEFLRERSAELLSVDFVLFYTGWEDRWGTEEYCRGAFPVPDEEASRYLVSCGLKGVGTDALSVDTLADKEQDAHKILLGGGLVIVENLKLKKLVNRENVMFFALPLKYEHADGAPVRAIAEFREFPEKEAERV